MDEGWRGEGRAFSKEGMLCGERFKGWNEMFRGQHIYRGMGKTEVNGYLVVINSGKVLDFVNWGGMNRVAGRRKGTGFRRQGVKISQP